MRERSAQIWAHVWERWRSMRGEEREDCVIKPVKRVRNHPFGSQERSKTTRLHKLNQEESERWRPAQVRAHAWER